MNDRPLHDGWLARRASDVPQDGAQLTSASFEPSGWLAAVVPGTVLTTLMHNDSAGDYPDPYFGLNSRADTSCKSDEARFRHDISCVCVGTDAYTFWFYNAFTVAKPSAGRRVWLELRGINESADVWLNGRQLNTDGELCGMFVRHLFDVTDVLDASGRQRLGVHVAPPRSYGTPGGNGGQAPMIGDNVTMRYTVGWDWIIPIADRNTGIWDRVSLHETGPVLLRDPHASVQIAEERDATIRIGVDLHNATNALQNGTLVCRLDGVVRGRTAVTVGAGGTTTVWLDPFVERNAALWWPNGFGSQPLHDLELELLLPDGSRSDIVTRRIGLREVEQTTTPVCDAVSEVDARTFVVNGRPLFLRGGNWIGTDARLRLSAERYDDEVRLYAGTGLSMLRVWGGGIAERPEFYEACDRYGIVVMQDFWLSSENPNTDAPVFQKCAEDTIRMLRIHPSLIVWCGANECDPPAPLDTGLPEAVRTLDGTRGYIANSLRLSTDKMRHPDGPYGLLDPIDQYFEHPLFHSPTPPFNPEIGALGIPVVETLRLTMPEADLARHPQQKQIGRCVIDEDWYWHSFSQMFQKPFGDQVYAYGDATSIERYAFQSQLVQLVQYQALIEGISLHMWRWYTGVLIWKAQNPWPGLRAALYDWYLDQTGGYFGVRRASEPLHVQLDVGSAGSEPPHVRRGETFRVAVVNQTAAPVENATIDVAFFAADGTMQAGPTLSGVRMNGNAAGTVSNDIAWPQWPVVFVRVRLEAATARRESFYWRHVTAPDYTSLQSVPRVALSAKAIGRRRGGREQIDVTLHNPTAHMTLWVRLQMLRADGRTRILPTHYSDNYVCLTPGSDCTIAIDYAGEEGAQLWLEGYNVDRTQMPVQWQPSA